MSVDILRATEGAIVPVDFYSNGTDKAVSFEWKEIHNLIEKCIDSISVKDSYSGQTL